MTNGHLDLQNFKIFIMLTYYYFYIILYYTILSITKVTKRWILHILVSIGISVQELRIHIFINIYATFFLKTLQHLYIVINCLLYITIKLKFKHHWPQKKVLHCLIPIVYMRFWHCVLKDPVTNLTVLN